ncbi:hypothetical protein QJS66_00245 [Kocuria rhizophila]|nr:hypothetical protein QJS66_00245 [Kocuria rhizophila]
MAGELLLTLAPPPGWSPACSWAPRWSASCSLVRFARLTGASGRRTRALPRLTIRPGSGSAGRTTTPAPHRPARRTGPGPVPPPRSSPEAPGHHHDALHGSGQPPVGRPSEKARP